MNASQKTQSISHLLDDHQAIRQLLRAYEHFLQRVERGCEGGTKPEPVFEPREIWDFLDYLSEQLLMCHEEKEEIALLPELSRHGLSWTDTNLQHTRQEHRHIRYLMRSLRQSVHQSRAWSRDECRHFLSISRELATLLQHHMEAEEKHLFDKLDASFSPEDDARLVGQFESIAADFQQMPDAQKLQASGEEFVSRYGKRD